MKPIGIQIKRFPYEEPYHLNLVFAASNGSFNGFLEYYCNVSDLKDIGRTLKAFPKKVPDVYLYEIGSVKPEDNFAYHFALRAYTVDNSGHCALQVDFDNNGKGPEGAACRFSIRADTASLNRLGELMLEFAELKHHELNWTVNGDGDTLKTKEEINTEQISGTLRC